MKIPIHLLKDVQPVLSNTVAKYVKALNAPDYVSFRKYQVEELAGGTFH
jgi:hypothetical protein